MPHPPYEPLTSALESLASFGVVPTASEAFGADLQSAEDELNSVVLDEIPAYLASGNPEIVPELGEHTTHHVNEVQRLLTGGKLESLDFVAEHARRRAEQKFPLEATLHSYRCGHRVLSRRVRDAALATADEAAQVRRVVAAVADFAMEYTDLVSRIATSEYVARTRVLAEAEGDRRTELLNVLLRGYDESDGRVADLLRRAGYLEQRLSFCVATTQSVDPVEMKNPARARRLADSMSDAVGGLPIRVLVGIRDNTVIAVFSDTRRMSGWTPQQTALADRLREPLRRLGPSVLVGVSNDVPSTSHVPKACEEARLALGMADVSSRVVHYADIPVRSMMLNIASSSIRSALPGWVSSLLAADKRGVLVATLGAYADSDMNVLKAADLLDVHPNTIYARAQKITDVTGKDMLRYHDLTELLLASECATPRPGSR